MEAIYVCVNNGAPSVSWELINMDNRNDFYSFNSNFDDIGLVKTGVTFNTVTAKLCSGNTSFISSSLTIMEAQQFNLSRIICNGDMLILRIKNSCKLCDIFHKNCEY